MNIHIIGGGNLGVAIALGLSKSSKHAKVTVTRRNITSIEHLKDKGISVSSDNAFGISEADTIILTIKPY